jgi:uncharacterized protein with von Willebrand factor type A (vWA) domain
LNDLRADAAGFASALARHGIAPAPGQTEAFLRALALQDRAQARDLYWCARVALLSRIDDLEQFDDAFRAYWAGVPNPPEDEPPPAHAHESALRRPAFASSEERLRERDFATLSDEERARAQRMLARLRAAAERRRSRRLRAGRRRGRLDWRETVRWAMRTGGETARLRYAARRAKVRPLVFLCDVSGSMEPYARALLHYAHASAAARPKVRAFAFATRLTDLSPMLRLRDADEALARVAAALPDYGSGTRIGAALRAFNDGYAGLGATRGATVVILSDGWEREDPALVAEQMSRLRRLARRIVWVNPQKKHPAYEPLARGMAAALPYVDAFVEGHNLRSLDAIADAIEGST